MIERKDDRRKVSDPISLYDRYNRSMESISVFGRSGIDRRVAHYQDQATLAKQEQRIKRLEEALREAISMCHLCLGSGVTLVSHELCLHCKPWRAALEEK